ncbi:MAG: siphovirus Gp157 family protein [Gammaproteobacteria bacterium]|nr:siphovirus Gp157 family protein [Gammaproteobacteria bacterium]
MSKLYEVAAQYRELEDQLDTDDASLAEAIRDTLEAIGGEFNDKAQAVVHIGLNIDADCAALDKEIDRLKQRKASLVNRNDNLREYLRVNMVKTGINKISCPLFTITLALGREVAVIDVESDLPDDLVTVKTVIAPNKAEILKLLKAGEVIPGAHIERSQSTVRIK